MYTSFPGSGRGNRLSVYLIPLLHLAISVHALARPSSGPLDITVCVFEQGSSTPLDSARVEAYVEGASMVSGMTSGSGCVTLSVPVPVSIEENALPERVMIGPPYPNPASREAAIPVRSIAAHTVEVQLFDLLGRRVKSKKTVSILPGENMIQLDLSGLSTGVYVYSLSGEAFNHTGTMVLSNRATLLPPAESVMADRPAFQHIIASQAVELSVIREGYHSLVTTREIAPGETVELFLVADTGESADMIPLNDLGAGTYLGFQGGLYPGGLNSMPATHYDRGLTMANSVVPLDVDGNPDPVSGKIIMMSLGMSNTTQEFCSQNARPPCDPWTFMGQAAADSDVDTTSLVIINGALGGQPAEDWDAPEEYNYDRVKTDRIESLGLSEKQVQVVWVKQANPRPQVSLPALDADAYTLSFTLARIARAIKIRYPNIKQVFFSSRIYAGYAEGVSRLNPEPYAYESGFSVKWLIEAQIDQMQGKGMNPDWGDLNYETVAPWVAWSAYLWANGMTPRSDGLIWVPEDFADDFTHPGQPGEEKVGAMLLDFFKTSPYTACWFLKNGVCE